MRLRAISENSNSRAFLRRVRVTWPNNSTVARWRLLGIDARDIICNHRKPRSHCNAKFRFFPFQNRWFERQILEKSQNSWNYYLLGCIFLESMKRLQCVDALSICIKSYNDVTNLYRTPQVNRFCCPRFLAIKFAKTSAQNFRITGITWGS